MAAIDDAMAKFCEAGARALYRYPIDIRRGPPTSPKYFMASLIMNELGDYGENSNRLAVTLETKVYTLKEYNDEAKARHGDLAPSDRVKLPKSLAIGRWTWSCFRVSLGSQKISSIS